MKSIEAVGKSEEQRGRKLTRIVRADAAPTDATKNVSSDDFVEIVAGSAAMRRILDVVRLVGPTEARVLITGETGTGKNLIAKAIHLCHPRRCGETFRRTNVGALVPELAASQLFGHVRGAFTGAGREHTGIVTDADKGTLFLDEISTAALNVQVMLLTLLEVNRVNPVGGSKDDVRPVDIRVLSATSLSPRDLLNSDTFRPELFFRIAEYVIEIPALRDRREDIPLLAEYFLAKANEPIRTAPDGVRTLLPLQQIDQEGRGKLCDGYDWPGNVRELEHVIRAAVVRSRESPEETRLLAKWIEFPAYSGNRGAGAIMPHDVGTTGSLADTVAAFRRRCCEQALQKSHGNKTAAARSLGIDHKTLDRYLDECAAWAR